MTIIPPGKTLIQATFAVDWASFDNDDLADDDDPTPAPDEGWYVTVTLGGQSFSIGPDHYGPGFQSIDEAVAFCRKYAEDRSFEWSPPSLDFTVGKWVDATDQT